jgi:hypothetical protein
MVVKIFLSAISEYMPCTSYCKAQNLSLRHSSHRIQGNHLSSWCLVEGWRGGLATAFPAGSAGKLAVLRSLYWVPFLRPSVPLPGLGPHRKWRSLRRFLVLFLIDLSS